MSKKQSFLKRNPLIPSIFFILFAWALLYLITGVKGASKSNPLLNQSSGFSFQNTETGWQLELSEEKIAFKKSPEQNQDIYLKPKVKRLRADERHAVQVFSAKNEDSEILIYLTHFKSSVYQVIIHQDGKEYYYYGKQ